MSVLQQYKCPCCDGAIEFNSTAQKMVCPYCGTEFEMEALASYDEVLNSVPGDEMNWDSSAGGQWEEGETEHLRIFACQSCGGEIVGDENTGATACPYCGNPVVMMGQFAGDLKPDLVIPFKLDKNAAMVALKKHYSGKVLLPKVFSQQNHIEEVKGIYVPFWLFDADADAHVRYNATRVRHWHDSEYNYTDTSHYLVIRNGSIGFDRVPVDGSSKIDDILMESIEPFDHRQAVDFQTAYLAGYLADKYDVNAESSITRANERIRTSTEAEFLHTVHGYSSVIPKSSNIALKNGTAKYALYPVWILSTRWNGQNFLFAMNGQTGKMAGDLPVDKGLRTKWLLGVFGAASAAAFALSYLLWLL